MSVSTHCAHRPDGPSCYDCWSATRSTRARTSPGPAAGLCPVCGFRLDPAAGDVHPGCEAGTDDNGWHPRYFTDRFKADHPAWCYLRGCCPLHDVVHVAQRQPGGAS